MKGVILAGGTGSRLAPMTRVTNKHLLPVYDKPMIMYPLQTLIDAGLKDIMIISGKGHAGHFLELLGSGREYGVRLNYAVQEEPKGIAHALSLAEDFADEENLAVILGDNLYEDTFSFDEFKSGARIYLKEVDDPQRFGVPSLDGTRVVKITEKPNTPDTSFAVSGLYLYDTTVFDKIRNLIPSLRGEFEITDVNNQYIEEGVLQANFVEGFWTDAGTVDSLHKAGILMKQMYGK